MPTWIKHSALGRVAGVNNIALTVDLDFWQDPSPKGQADCMRFMKLLARVSQWHNIRIELVVDHENMLTTLRERAGVLDIGELINIDAHDDLAVLDNTHKLTCGNWVRAFMQDPVNFTGVKKYTWYDMNPRQYPSRGKGCTHYARFREEGMCGDDWKNLHQINNWGLAHKYGQTGLEKRLRSNPFNRDYTIVYIGVCISPDFCEPAAIYKAMAWLLDQHKIYFKGGDAQWLQTIGKGYLEDPYRKG